MIKRKILALGLAVLLMFMCADYVPVMGKEETEEIVLSAENYDVESSEETVLHEDIDGKGTAAVVTEEDGRVVWQFTVKTAGSYYVKVNYYTIPGNSMQMERRLLIDGDEPVDSPLTFKRSYSITGETEYDLQGNQIRSAEEENVCWQEVYIKDANGYTEEECSIELTEGIHTLVLDSLLDRMAIGYLVLTREKPIVESYDNVLEQMVASGAKNATGELRKIQAENYLAKSDASVLIQNDRTSAATEPSSADTIVYNTMGGGSWAEVGQWIEWQIEVPKDGFYELGMRWRQSTKLGGMSSRKLTIDGNAPFREAAQLSFAYDNSWQSSSLGEEEPYLFYLTEGVHTIRMTANLGEMAKIYALADHLIDTLNGMYMQIIMVSGTSPDLKRDYNFKAQIPDVIEQYHTVSGETQAIIDETKAVTDGSQTVAELENIKDLLDRLYEDPETTAKRLGDFSSSISSLANWLSESRRQPLEIDYLYLKVPNSEKLKANSGFFHTLWFHLKQLFSSYRMDYTKIGNTTKIAEDEEVLQVWVIAGTEQAQVIQKLINEQFIPNNAIAVQMQNVTKDALMPAIFAGRGPDVVLNLDEASPVNYALRDVVMDLRQFNDLDEVLAQYEPCSYEAFMLEDSLYALPTTLDYPVLFYRKDVVEELGISSKDCQTWDTMMQVVLPKLQMKNLKFGLTPGVNSFLMFYYQGDNSLYNEENTKILLDSKESINAFTSYSNIYTDYKQDLSFNFVNLFRSGEMPMAVMPYSQYYQLAVFAPEIDGEWGMMLAPGTKDESGKINHTVACTVTGASIMSGADSPEDAWQFLKWWAGDETQATYAREIETVLGIAGRVNPASNEARDSIPWTKEIKDLLGEQLGACRGVPQVPGSYYVGRYFDFAFRDVVYDGDDIVQTLISITEDINTEIQEKTYELMENGIDAKK